MNSLADDPPRATRVQPLSDHRLQVRFSDGVERVLHLAKLIDSREVFWRLRQERYFRQVSTDPLGGICWPEGEDLAPEGLLRYVNP